MCYTHLTVPLSNFYSTIIVIQLYNKCRPKWRTVYYNVDLYSCWFIYGIPVWMYQWGNDWNINGINITLCYCYNRLNMNFSVNLYLLISIIIDFFFNNSFLIECLFFNIWQCAEPYCCCNCCRMNSLHPDCFA